MKITAFHGGGDWSDASADYLVLPDGMDVDAEMATRNKWLREEYRPAMRRGENPEYISILDWLLRRGAVKPTEDQLEVVYYV